jgi:hypothetical protein
VRPQTKKVPLQGATKLRGMPVYRVVALLCVIAVIRTFVFAAVFPFFNNVDEQAHVDLVIKYAHGEPPHGYTNSSEDAARYFGLYSTPEYFLAPEKFETGHYPQPNWTLPPEQRHQLLTASISAWESRVNHESGEPPLYYAIAGVWFDLGKLFGLEGGRLLYWVRFLNVAFAALLVWIGYLAARSITPDHEFFQITVPALLAVWPQSSFYSIQSDPLSPLCFGIAFVGLVRLLQVERLSIFLCVWTGLAVAATCLVKTVNLPLVAVATAVVLFKSWRLARQGILRQGLWTLCLFLACVAVPLVSWFAWNHHYFGEITAARAKTELLGWTQKPLSDWWSHPIFTLHGAKEFWWELIASFWRGEFIWHGRRLAGSLSDAFYWISSALMLVAAVGELIRHRSTGELPGQFSLWAAIFSFLSLVAFLALLSIAFDFGECVYPSRAHPYFTSGRLISAAAIPFFLLYAYAIECLGNWTKRNWMRWAILGAVLLVVVVSQLDVNAPVFSSQFNFFHVPAR